MSTETTTKAAPRRTRGEYAKTRARKMAILDAALEVFAESGYRSGSLKEVATRVGISEAGLLHHFPSKVQLLEAVLEHRDELTRERFALVGNDGVGTLRALVDLATYNASIPGVVELYCVLSAEATAPDHPAHGYFVTRYVESRELIATAFRRLQQAGRLSLGADPGRAANATIALMDGLQLQWLLDREAVDMARELSDFFATFVEGFRETEPLDAVTR